jgi:hypothetical protein
LFNQEFTMRKFQLGLVAGTVSAFVLALFLTGCGGTPRKPPRGDEEEETPSRTKTPSSGGGAKQKEPIKVTEAGVIKGVIKLEGNKSDLNLAGLTKALQDGMKQDRDYCLSGSEEEKSQQEYRIGDNGQVGNVFVWIEPEDSRKNYFEIPEAQLKALPKEVKVEQPHCAFLPHCSVMFSRYQNKPTGQKLHVLNNAKISHNTKVKGGPRNPEVNQTLKRDATMEVELVPENDPITIECNIHPWMKGYVRAFNHPFATVSVEKADTKDQNFGTYEIKGVPVGASVRIFAWHEKAGFLGDEKGKVIKLEKETKADFSMTAK